MAKPRGISQRLRRSLSHSFTTTVAALAPFPPPPPLPAAPLVLAWLCPPTKTASYTGYTTLPGENANPSQDTQHEAAQSITTPSSWDSNPSQDNQHETAWIFTTSPQLQSLVHRRLPSRKQLRELYYFPWMEC